MTISQMQAVWELCRQGLPLIADEAEEHWETGQVFDLDMQVSIPRGVEHLLERCNREVDGGGSAA
jgi:hypothetical protein